MTAVKAFGEQLVVLIVSIVRWHAQLMNAITQWAHDHVAPLRWWCHALCRAAGEPCGYC